MRMSFEGSEPYWKRLALREHADLRIYQKIFRHPYKLPLHSYHVQHLLVHPPTHHQSGVQAADPRLSVRPWAPDRVLA